MIPSLLERYCGIYSSFLKALSRQYNSPTFFSSLWKAYDEDKVVSSNRGSRDGGRSVSAIYTEHSSHVVSHNGDDVMLQGEGDDEEVVDDHEVRERMHEVLEIDSPWYTGRGRPVSLSILSSLPSLLSTMTTPASSSCDQTSRYHYASAVMIARESNTSFFSNFDVSENTDILLSPRYKNNKKSGGGGLGSRSTGVNKGKWDLKVDDSVRDSVSHIVEWSPLPKVKKYMDMDMDRS